MRTFPIYAGTLLAAAPLAAFLLTACGDTGPDANTLNMTMNGGTTVTGSAGTSSPTGGSAGTAAVTGGAAGTGVVPMGGNTGSGGTGGDTTAGGSTTGGSGGSGGEAPTGPYAPRSGSFKMLVYSATKGFRHDGSIVTGKAMLTQIAQEQGFEIKITETNEDITPEGLAQYEIIFFMNSTGDIFNDTEQKTYEDWMTMKNGAFGGTHSSTDTENGWAFYSEVTGQYYNGHGGAGTPDQIKFETNMLNHPALKGLPNPWQRNEEWYKFDSWQVWSVKPGFQILGKKNADAQPIMWIREWGNFRSFYTAIGHDASVFQDPDVKKHLTGGIMWAVRREHLIK